MWSFQSDSVRPFTSTRHFLFLNQSVLIATDYSVYSMFSLENISQPSKCLHFYLSMTLIISIMIFDSNSHLNWFSYIHQTCFHNTFCMTIHNTSYNSFSFLLLFYQLIHLLLTPICLSNGWIYSEVLKSTIQSCLP